jgi:hypothetical protein
MNIQWKMIIMFELEKDKTRAIEISSVVVVSCYYIYFFLYSECKDHQATKQMWINHIICILNVESRRHLQNSSMFISKLYIYMNTYIKPDNQYKQMIVMQSKAIFKKCNGKKNVENEIAITRESKAGLIKHLYNKIWPLL